MGFMRSFMIPLFVTVIGLNTAFAGGGDSAGGTHSEVEQFVATASFLISDKSPLSDEEKRLLSNTLDTLLAKPQGQGLLMVDHLDGPPPEHESEYAAWGSIGKIQLKNESPKNPDHDSWGKRVRLGLPVAHIVYHELMRASGKYDPLLEQSPDHQFQQSILKYHLDRLTPISLIDVNGSGGQKLDFRWAEQKFWSSTGFEIPEAGDQGHDEIRATIDDLMGRWIAIGSSTRTEPSGRFDLKGVRNHDGSVETIEFKSLFEPRLQMIDFNLRNATLDKNPITKGEARISRWNAGRRWFALMYLLSDDHVAYTYSCVMNRGERNRMTCAVRDYSTFALEKFVVFAKSPGH